ncbi:MAG: hypothetical protein Q8R39_00715 [bacterium]|nr:hypothetical protein [bacterium]
METQIYTISTRPYPPYPGNGEDVSYRVDEIFECTVCAVQTNAARSAFRCDITVKCPHGGKEWHKKLAKKVKWIGKPHPRSYRDELQKEIDDERRDHADETNQHDIVGLETTEIKTVRKLKGGYQYFAERELSKIFGSPRDFSSALRDRIGWRR